MGRRVREHFALAAFGTIRHRGDQGTTPSRVVAREIDPIVPPATASSVAGMPMAYTPVRSRAARLAAIANGKWATDRSGRASTVRRRSQPGRSEQESHATAIRTICRVRYEVDGAIGSTRAGRTGTAASPRAQRLFASFGDRLARMFSTLPDDAPIEVRDTTSLRWRGATGAAAMIFLSTHQPQEPLASVKDVCLGSLEDGIVTVPDVRLICQRVVARWPLRLEVARNRIEWATASVAGLVPGERDPWCCAHTTTCRWASSSPPGQGASSTGAWCRPTGALSRRET